MFEIFKSSRFETSEQFCEKLNKSTRFFPLILVVRLLGDEFFRKSLFIVNLKLFNSQIRGVKMAFLRLDVLE
jgi:hypothetical protein